MTIAQSVLPEFDHETANTRKLLERVPEEHASWKPHAKSWSLGELALHLVNLPTWTTVTLTQSELELEPTGGPPPRPERRFESRSAALKTFDENVARARATIAACSDADMMKPWTLKKRGETVFTMPRVAVLRSFVMNHMVHHRGQLTVYLRMRDVPLPPIYGPTADDDS